MIPLPLPTGDLRAWAERLVAVLKQKELSVSPDSSASGVAAGTLAPFASAVIPSGWLLCDGRAVLRSHALFSILGTTWGSGDGVTTFNLPDLRGRTLVGATVAQPLGSLFGAEEVTLTVDQLPSHTHGVDDPGHDHSFSGASHNHSITDPGHTHAFTGSPHTHTITDPGHVHTGGAAAATTLGAGGGGVQTASTGSATTGITVDNATAGGTNASATTGITTGNTSVSGTVGEGETGVTIEPAGGGDPVPLLPPSASINWIIKE